MSSRPQNLVIGGTGFVGQYLVRELVRRGQSCRVLARPTSETGVFAGLDGVEVRIGDICDSSTLSGVADGVKHVYHLAALGHVAAQSEEAYRNFVRVNVDGTRNVMQACAGTGVEKFVHFSSTAAMGLIRKTIVDENDPPQPVTPYQKSKLQSEQAALESGKRLGLPTVIVRPCMIYGAGGEGEFKKIANLMRRGLFPRLGLGKALTPLVHVKDVVNGAIKAAEKGRAGEVYLLTSASSIERARLRELVLAAWGTRAPYPYVPVWAVSGLAGLFEWWAKLSNTTPIATRRNIASMAWDRAFSIEKARRELGYEPEVDFEQGIAETLAWFKEAS
jgi:nucleoside-diphosphate-sugar epimerase